MKTNENKAAVFRHLMWILSIVFMLSALPFAAAESEAVEDDPGVTPDSVWYGLDKAMDRLSLAMTMDKEKKAQKGLKIANERLAELKKMLHENKFEDADKAESEYESALATTTQETAAAGDDDEATLSSLEAISKIQNETENHYEKVMRIKLEILASKTNLTADQKKHLEEVFQKIIEKAEDVQAKIDAKKENAKIKYKALSGKTETEVEVEVENIDRRSGLENGRRERTERQIESARESMRRTRERLELYLNSTNQTNSTLQERLDAWEAELEQARERLRDGGKDAQEISAKIREYGNEISIIANTLHEAKQNGTWNETKLRLEEAIRQRHEELRKVVEERRLQHLNETKIKIERDYDSGDNETERENETDDDRGRAREQDRDKDRTRDREGRTEED